MARPILTDKQHAALKVVDLAKAQALADNHFLSAAVGRLRVEPCELLRPLATDGYSLGVDADLLCAQFKDEREAPKHDLIHTVLHCVFLHPYVSPNVDARLWSLACDIAAERNVAEVCGRRKGPRGQGIASALAAVEGGVKGTVTAEKIYRALCAGKWSEHVGEWEELFLVDDHAPWYVWAAPAEGGGQDDGDGGRGDRSSSQVSDCSAKTSQVVGDGSERGEVVADGKSPEGGSAGQTGQDGSDEGDDSQEGSEGASGPHGEGGAGADGGAGGESEPGPQGGGGPSPRSGEGEGQGRGAGGSSKEIYSKRTGLGMREASRPDFDAERAGWNRVAKALAVNLQTYAKGRGRSLSALVEELEESAHERVDYADFLRQFAIPGEVLRVSDDEFDYVYYTYGLKLYGNLPLIEPLEYREEKRIREFVIVIDTSGSVYGEIVKRFIDATFDILKSTEAFFERVHVRIIQCDAAVQSDDVITSLDELKEWGRTMRIHGCGGTDFRPAFAYVDKLVEDGEFENLGGLIYFTDGWGEYPEWMPEYKTAFVFYDDSYRPECVPTWAAQIVLDENRI